MGTGANLAEATSIAPTGTILRGLKWLAIAALAAMALFFYIEVAVRYTNFSQASYGTYWPNRGWLIAHLSGGSLALLLGPFQLWSGLGRKRMRIHPWIGRLYLCGVLLGSMAAFYLASVSQLRTFGISLAALGTVWLTSAAMAYLAIRNRQIESHKQWMIRSYVLTYAFVTFRWIDKLGLFDGLGLEKFATIGWLCWTLPLFFTEVAFQWKRVARRPAHGGA